MNVNTFNGGFFSHHCNLCNAQPENDQFTGTVVVATWEDDSPRLL